MHFRYNDLLGVKVFTILGTFILAIAYSTPRNFTLPISLNQLFSHNIPVLSIGDVNARHNALNNVPLGCSANPKSHQIK